MSMLVTAVNVQTIQTLYTTVTIVTIIEDLALPHLALVPLDHGHAEGADLPLPLLPLAGYQVTWGNS